jgi:acyl carrier protein
MSETGDRVKKIVVEHLGVEPDKVTEDASFIDDLGADSLDIVELVMAFEESSGSKFRTTPRRRSRRFATLSIISTRTRADRGTDLAAELRLERRHERLPEYKREAVCFGELAGV